MESGYTLRFFEIAVTIICAFVAVVLKQEVLVFFALSILPLNLANYFKQLYQATGEFFLYGKIMNANTILIFFANMMWVYFGRFIYLTSVNIIILIMYLGLSVVLQMFTLKWKAIVFLAFMYIISMIAARIKAQRFVLNVIAEDVC